MLRYTAASENIFAYSLLFIIPFQKPFLGKNETVNTQPIVLGKIKEIGWPENELKGKIIINYEITQIH